MTSPIIYPPRLSKNASEFLRTRFESGASDMPGRFLVVASAEEVLFKGSSGPFNILQGEKSSLVEESTIIWLSSATRFVVALAYLQLVESGKITLDSPMSEFSLELERVSTRILTGWDTEDLPIFQKATGPITLRHMLNGTSGFAPEFDGTVKRWKAQSKIGGGSINTCKIENLIYTPPCSQPGDHYAYGPNLDWLSYIFPKIAGQDLESYLQAKVFQPLGIHTATFFPYDTALEARVMPLHWLAEDKDGKTRYEKWTGQQSVHLLPKNRSGIEYPTGGSGLYASAADYALLLQNVLKGYKYQASTIATPLEFTPLLSPLSYKLLLSADLSTPQTNGLDLMLNGYFNLSHDQGDTLIGPSDVNMSLGDLPLYVGEGRKAGWGRRPGTAGWGGAAGTDFYIDPVTGIAVVFSTQLLPGSGNLVKGLKKSMEKAVYEALDME